MVDATHQSFRADDRSYFSLLKKEIHKKVSEAGYSQKKISEIDIIVSEMTSNLFKYAKDGEILVGHVQNDLDDYFEIISIDNGPGMNDPSKMIFDGVSTTNTLGHGLGSIDRLSDKFEIYSQKNWGTIALSRINKDLVPKKKLNAIEFRTLVVAKPGEIHSGDGCYFEYKNGYLKLLVADGLGHGIEANKAVNAAVKAFKECASTIPAEILRFMHAEIRKTRGMVGTVGVYNLQEKSWEIAGIGNISMKMVNSFTSKSQMSYNGIIGHNIPTSMTSQRILHTEFNQLIFCSDGLKTRWDISKYPSINKYDLSVTAAALYKDFARRTDDMSVVIVKSH